MGAGASVQSVDMDTLKLVSCKKRQRLAADPNRVTPDIDPKSCKEGSISCGKDNRIFVIKSGAWSEMNGLSEESKKAICERLNSGKKKSVKRTQKTNLGDAGDVPMISLGSMKKKACSVDAKLNANPKRRAPPIQPKTCKEGSVAMGKDGKPYVIKGGRWITAEKSLSAKQKELVKERLAQKMSGTRKAMEKAKSKAPKTPKRGKPKGSKKKAASKKSAKRATTPKRPRVKKM